MGWASSGRGETYLDLYYSPYDTQPQLIIAEHKTTIDDIPPVSQDTRKKFNQYHAVMIIDS